MRRRNFALLILSFVVASAQAPSAELDEKRLLRRIRFGQRELYLPLQLENDQLTVTNDKLDITIANLEGREPDTDRVLIDQYLADQTKATINDAKVFAQMYHLSRNPVHELVELDDMLDNADEKCHAPDPDKHLAIFNRLADAQLACSDLEAISSAISSQQIAIPQVWVSVFREDTGYRSRTGFKLLIADTDQLKRDEASRIDPKAKKMLLRSDRSILIDDRQIWLTEMSEQETLEFNIKHPEYRMADMIDTLALLKQIRAGTAGVVANFRKDLLKAH